MWSSGSVNGEEMSFRIENVAVDAERLLVVAKEQVKVFQRLAQEERFHHVSQFNLRHAPDVAQGAVTVFHPSKLFKCLQRIQRKNIVDRIYESFQVQFLANLENFPAPVLVGGVARQVVHVPQALHRFWSQKIVRVGRFDDHVVITVILFLFCFGKKNGGYFVFGLFGVGLTTYFVEISDFGR